MQKSKLMKTRKGFTLVEVALAVAVGLIIIGGAVLGYNAVKDNASNSNARNRVLSAVTMIEEYSAANGGQYPVSAAAGTGPFTTMWVAKRADDKAASPWGGASGGVTVNAANTGVTEVAASNFGTDTAANAALAATAASLLGYTDGAAVATAATMQYASSTTAATPWAKVVATSTSSDTTVKNYAVGIADKTGDPWWDVKGGK